MTNERKSRRILWSIVLLAFFQQGQPFRPTTTSASASPQKTIIRVFKTTTSSSRIQSIRQPQFRTPNLNWKNRPHRRSQLSSFQNWEGDDIRWSSKLARRWSRRRLGEDPTPVRTAILCTSFLLYLYQSITTLNVLRIQYPSHWPRDALTMILDVLMGSCSIRGSPLLSDFGFFAALSSRQPHRFVASALVHGSIFHWLVNIDFLRRQPTWLETGLGSPLYASAFLVGIVGGNVGHLKLAEDVVGSCICGVSGGIAGLYGLMYMCLIKMGNPKASSKLLRGMAPLLVAGYFLESMSNAAHFGGFFAGLLLGFACAPSYKKSYSMRRKNSMDYDPYSREYRSSMGFGVMPTQRGMLSLLGLWIVAIGAFLLAPASIQAAPKMILKGLLRPGSI